MCVTNVYVLLVYSRRNPEKKYTDYLIRAHYGMIFCCLIILPKRNIIISTLDFGRLYALLLFSSLVLHPYLAQEQLLILTLQGMAAQLPLMERRV
jgi:hypothetical protein